MCSNSTNFISLAIILLKVFLKVGRDAVSFDLQFEFNLNLLRNAYVYSQKKLFKITSLHVYSHVIF